MYMHRAQSYVLHYIHLSVSPCLSLLLLAVSLSYSFLPLCASLLSLLHLGGSISDRMTQTIVLKLSIDCDACKRKVKKALDGIEGVDTIDVDKEREKVTVTGTVEAKTLLKKLAKIGKKAELTNSSGYTNATLYHFNNPLTEGGGGGGKAKKKNSQGQGGLTKKGNNNTANNNNNSNNMSSRAHNIAKFDTDYDNHNTNLAYAHFFSDDNTGSCSVM